MARLNEAIARLMEDRREDGSHGADPPALAPLLTQLRDRLPPEHASVAVAFARELFAKVDPVLLQTIEPDSLIALTISAFRFTLRRDRQRVAVRAYRPQQDQNGWTSPNVVIEIILDDHPFIVDTVSETLQREGGDIRLLLHPLIGVRRSADGILERVGPPQSLPRRESFLHVEVAGVEPTPELQQLLAERLRQLQLATEDYQAMKRRVAALAGELSSRRLPAPWVDDAPDVAAFLQWLGEGNFVYLGYREYTFEGGEPGPRRATVRSGTGLGLLRDEARSRYHTSQPIGGAVDQALQSGGLLIVSNTNASSPVHRIVPMQDVFMLEINEKGLVSGGYRLLGLFTSKADSALASEVPILQSRLSRILTLDHVVEESHDHKELASLFDTIPKNELFASRVDDLRQLLKAISGTQAGGGMRLLCRADAWGRSLLVVVVVPRARFSTELHERVGALLRSELQAVVLHEHLSLDERPQARLHYCLAVSGEILVNPPLASLQRKLDDLLSTWDDDLRAALARFDPTTAARLAGKYGNAFSAGYKAETGVADAVRDIQYLEALLETGEAQLELGERTPPVGIAGRLTALRIYSRLEALVLSDFIPVLENLGLRVFGEDIIRLCVPEGGDVLIRTLFVQAAADPELDVAGSAKLLLAALQSVLVGRTESDRLHTLVLTAGLDWRSVDLLRAYVEQARQVGLGSRRTLIDALADHPECAKRLFLFFAARFAPNGSSLSAEQRQAGPAEDARTSFLQSLDSVESLVHDGILRALGETVAATVRTNFYQQPQAGPHTEVIALKMEAFRLAHLPEPRPMFETLVHAPQIEGVHLRAGRVARGGIRLSDRPDELRAEVLGLMKTQVVKNAVIVPVGAKGGFVLKGRPLGAAIAPAEAEAAYRTFVSALLSISDNLERGHLVPPAGTVIYDDPDPYLVVAADKGTSTFSDLANEIAAEHRFWLADAFASGGRNGYDHKQLGITARGAWECARQHFRDLGRNIDHEPIDAIGIGDMSGDVFGNGMLRSRSIRLRAAFNHRHIFLDPDPDPERSYLERERLFLLPTSTWADYTSSCLSDGGGVFLRSAKTIALTPQVRAMLETETASLSGEEVVQAILCMRADLLWNGGVGTYVKASAETHNDVGDLANDRVRVDASELRVLVVAEGGNLGFTQRARVEFALAGGHINTDAIDNSGGVDCSDYEVNLKIALQPVVERGEASSEQRNQLLFEMAEETCRRVLEHNRRQATTLGADQVRSRTQLASFRDVMSQLEAEADLDRQLHHLPTREALRDRRSLFLGLTRPELAVLLAYAKLDLQRRILDSPLCDAAPVRCYFQGYFPEAVGRRFPAAVQDHPLRREITAVELANRLIDCMGIAFPLRLAGDTGRDLVDVVTAWTAAMAILDGETTLRRIDGEMTTRPVEAEQQCDFVFAQALERATKWILETQYPFDSIAGIIECFRKPARELLDGWSDRLTEDLRARHADDVARLVAAGVEESLAEHLIPLTAAEDALEICQIAREARTPVPSVADAYFQTVALVDLDWLRRVLPSTVSGEDRWERRAIGGLLDGLMYARRQITFSVLGCRAHDASIDQCLAGYAETHGTQLQRLNYLIDDLKTRTQQTLPALLVAMRELGRLARE